MYDGGKILTGLAIGLLLFTLPFWYGAAFSDHVKPNPEKPTQYTSCVKSTEYMRANHMDLLNEWRDEVVRDRDRVFTAEDGRKFNKSLTDTCLACHKSKKKFCDECHNYMSVKPYCWDCHINPEEVR